MKQQYAPPDLMGLPYYVPSQQGFENDIRALRKGRGKSDPPEETGDEGIAPAP